MFDTCKTKVIGLLSGEEIMTVRRAVFMEYRNVTDGQTDRRTDRIAISISCVSILMRARNLLHNTSFEDVGMLTMSCNY